jgi:carboxylesterase type B
VSQGKSLTEPHKSRRYDVGPRPKVLEPSTMQTLTAVLLLPILFVYGGSAPAGTAPVVDLGYVKYAGGHNATTGINYYRGIRYAESPTGDLRWREPVPIEQNTSYVGQTIDATQYGPGCYQGTPHWQGPPNPAPLGISDQSEDCLLLDVLVPVEPISWQLPVMVQIHGGGYTIGSSSTIAPGDALVNASDGGMIYVQIQYRLGMFGFLGGSEIEQNGVRNAGLYDQRAALNWVQRHISEFGGDPAKVTIIGIISTGFG